MWVALYVLMQCSPIIITLLHAILEVCVLTALGFLSSRFPAVLPLVWAVVVYLTAPAFLSVIYYWVGQNAEKAESSGADLSLMEIFVAKFKDNVSKFTPCGSVVILRS